MAISPDRVRLSEQKRLLTPCDWWIRWRDQPPVRQALARAHVEHFLPHLETALRQNQAAGRRPGNWYELADAVYRDVNHLRRRMSVVSASPKQSPQEYLALAGASQLAVEIFYPEKVDWIARACQLLCGNELTLEECRLHSRFCCQPAAALSQAEWGIVVRIDQRLHRVLRELIDGQQE